MNARRWWDVGAPVAPRPRWVDPKVAKNEEEKSRRRAASLADLIRDGAAAVGVGGAAGGVKPSAREIMRAAGVRVGVASEGGVLARGHKRALSMVDAREAEKVWMVWCFCGANIGGRRGEAGGCS